MLTDMLCCVYGTFVFGLYVHYSTYLSQMHECMVYNHPKRLHDELSREESTLFLLHVIDLLGFHLRIHALRVAWSYICQVKLKRKVLHNGDQHLILLHSLYNIYTAPWLCHLLSG